MKKINTVIARALAEKAVKEIRKVFDDKQKSYEEAAKEKLFKDKRVAQYDALTDKLNQIVGLLAKDHKSIEKKYLKINKLKDLYLDFRTDFKGSIPGVDDIKNEILLSHFASADLDSEKIISGIVSQYTSKLK